MSGYNLIRKIRRLEEECDGLGFVIDQARGYITETDGDLVSVRPKDANALPIYSRDADLFIGRLEDLEYWLRGIQWARNYDRMLGISSNKKRANKEDDYRHSQLVKKLAKDHANAQEGN
jgi:hypothetical protein